LNEMWTVSPESSLHLFDSDSLGLAMKESFDSAKSKKHGRLGSILSLGRCM